MCRCIAELYEDESYQGAKHTIQDATSSLTDIGFNDAASSAKIIGPCDWIFSRGDDFKGGSNVLEPENYETTIDWGQSNDMLSSLRPVPPCGTVAIVLYQHYSFEGRELVLHDSAPSLPNFNDLTSSIVVTGGTWRLYRNENYQGTSYIVGRGYRQGPGGNDYISSVEKL